MSIASYLNELDDASLLTTLTKCCASRAWVQAMSAARPFASDASVLDTAAATWWKLERRDWLAAFIAHPKIGDIESLRAMFFDTRTWASGEQSGVVGACDGTSQRLARKNRDYEARFGYIFIVCATSKTADQMLSILEERLLNDPDQELRVAAGEQLKITLLRLEKIVA